MGLKKPRKKKRVAPKYLFVLERAHYYTEAAQFSAVMIFTSVVLAEKYLNSRMSLEGNSLKPHPYLSKLKFKYDSKEGFYRARYNDDGVTTSFRLKKLNVVCFGDDIPASVCRTISGTVETTYTFKNGKTMIRRRLHA